MNRIVEKLVILWSWVAAALTVSVFGVFVSFLLLRGLKTVNASLFFGDVAPWQAITGALPVWNGIWPAVVGTACLVILSCFIAVPLGLCCGIYLAEYAAGRWKAVSDFAVDTLASMPSIVMGLFGFMAILFLRKTILPSANTCLLLSAICIAFLILPYVIRTTQVSMEALPDSLRLAGLSLGFSKWRNIAHVLVPAAGRGIVSGVILAIGRAAEDTAVILLTGVVANSGLPGSLTGKFEALPFSIYYLAAEYRTQAELDRAFGSALVLLIIATVLFSGALWLQKMIQKASH